MAGFSEKPDTGVKHEASDGTILELEPIDGVETPPEDPVDLELEPLTDEEMEKLGEQYDVMPREGEAEVGPENLVDSGDVSMEEIPEENENKPEVAEAEIVEEEIPEDSNNIVESQSIEPKGPVEVSLDNTVRYYENVYAKTKSSLEWMPGSDQRVKEINSILQQVSEGKLGMQYEKEKRSDGSYMVEKIKYEKGAGEIPYNQIESLSNTLKENEIEKSENAFEYVKSLKRSENYERYKNISLGEHDEFHSALDSKTKENNDFREKITLGSFALGGTSILSGAGAYLVLASPVGLPIVAAGAGTIAAGGLWRFGKGIYDRYKQKKALNDYKSAFVARGVREQISS